MPPTCAGPAHDTEPRAPQSPATWGQQFTASFDAVFAADAVRVVRTPVRASRANAICERVIDTIRRECLDRMLILGRRHLEAVLAEYVASITTRTGLSTSARHPASMRLLR